jgi:outer membrane protein TolC
MDKLIKATSIAALLVSAWPGSGFSQGGPAVPGPVLRRTSLEEAIEAALAGNTALAVAEARRDIAASQGRSASAPLWPQLAAEAGYTRSVDPVFAFGTKLRQGRFGSEDFDIAALNRPGPIGDWSANVGLRWSVLDPTAWAGRSAARRQAEAAAWSAVRTREATVLVTRVLYYQALAAVARLEAAAAADEAAGATVESFRRRRERGLLTEADLLQAEAEFAAARAQRAEAERARLDALHELGRELGWSPDTLPEPTDSLALPSPLPEQEFEPEARADLRALAAAAEAVGAARRRAFLSHLPALDAFALYATHSSDAFGFDEDDWTVGVTLRWTLFAGLARSADLQRTELGRRVARIEYNQALRDARNELDQAERAVSSGRQQVEATRAAWAAAESGRQLMRRRFDEGLATAADLLQAEARATAMREHTITALANYHIAVARLDFVRSQSNLENQR